MDHAPSDVHKAAMAKLKVERSRATGELAATSSTIGRLVIDGRGDEGGWRKSLMCAS